MYSCAEPVSFAALHAAVMQSPTVFANGPHKEASELMLYSAKQPYQQLGIVNEEPLEPEAGAVG